MSKLWQKSTTDTQSDTAKKVEAFTVGNDYELDQSLVPYDVAASIVHAKALKKAGVLSESELKKLIDTLNEVQLIWEKGEFEITVDDEDMHTAIENFLVKTLGDLGKKIHTARSRNDQILTAMRLFEKEKMASVLKKAEICASMLLDFADDHKTVPMPGFTHTRKAMLSSIGLWAGGFAELLILQIQASSGVSSLINKSPLGSAAGFGTSFDIDRDFEADELGFEDPLICSTTSQLSRGFIELQLVQYLSALTSIINRFSADVIQYSSESTSWLELNPVICTGSSIMPQKKNPDVAEIIRGYHAVISGHGTTLQMLTTNLTSGYHRDLQLSKEPVIDALQKTEESLKATQLLIENMSPNQESLFEACSSEIFAAEAAYKLVREKGITFREAYKKSASNPELTMGINAKTIMQEYSHLGSPGNPGTERLRKMLIQL